MELFSSSIAKLWDEWAIILLVSLSLVFQIILFGLGVRRKYRRGKWIRFIVWLSYLMADLVATFALGKLSKVLSEETSDKTQIDQNYVLTAMWAPLLLLHLGGPDTITAYSVADTQLWLRHGYGLVVQLLVAIYVLYRCWIGSWISFLTVFIFIAGIIKYGERTYALWFVNRAEPTVSRINSNVLDEIQDLRRRIPGVEVPVMSYLWLRALKPYLQNYTTNINLKELSKKTYELVNDTRRLPNLIEVELGLLFDVVFTKAAVIYNKTSLALRMVSFVCSIVVLVGFSVVSKEGYSTINVYFTYLLLSVAIFLEICAFKLMIFSDWGLVWTVLNHKKPFMTYIVQFLAPKILDQSRCSYSIGQFNLLHYYTMDSRHVWLSMAFSISDGLKKYWCQRYVKEFVYSELKELVFEQIRKSLSEVLVDGSKPFGNHDNLLKKKYNQAFRERKCLYSKSFDEYILSWHVAMEICEFRTTKENLGPMKARYKHGSIILSKYMMYLLVWHPIMLRITTGDTSFDNTCLELEKMVRVNELDDDAISIIVSKLSKSDRNNLHNVLVGGEGKEALIYDGRYIADLLFRHYKYNLWEVTFEVWVEILCYGALQCQTEYHAEQLGQGGELLTHVWLLLTLFGLTDKVSEQCESLWLEAKEHHIRSGSL